MSYDLYKYMDVNSLKSKLDELNSSEEHLAKKEKSKAIREATLEVRNRYSKIELDRIEKYDKWMLDNNLTLCEQCRRPHHDGMCECGRTEYNDEVDEMARVMCKIESRKQSEIRRAIAAIRGDSY